MSTCG